MENEEFDIEKITDRTLTTMEIGRENTIPWDKWWCKIIKRHVPTKPSLPHEQYKKDRLIIKNFINEEFAIRQDSHRLRVENAIGVYLLEGNESTESELTIRFRKAFNTNRNRVQAFEELSECDVPPEDSKILKRLAAVSQNMFDTEIMTVSRLRCLSRDTKQKLLAEMGCNLLLTKGK